MKYKIGAYLKQENLYNSENYRIFKVSEIYKNVTIVEIIYDFYSTEILKTRLDIFLDKGRWRIREIDKDEIMVEML